MLMLHCDLCENIIEVLTASANPDGWSSITITGYVRELGKTYGSTPRSIKKSLCPDCVPKIFDFSKEAPKSIQEQFEIAAVDYMTELAEEAVQCAVDNMEP